MPHGIVIHLLEPLNPTKKGHEVGLSREMNLMEEEAGQAEIMNLCVFAPCAREGKCEPENRPEKGFEPCSLLERQSS